MCASFPLYPCFGVLFDEPELKRAWHALHSIQLNRQFTWIESSSVRIIKPMTTEIAFFIRKIHNTHICHTTCIHICYLRLLFRLHWISNDLYGEKNEKQEKDEIRTTTTTDKISKKNAANNKADISRMRRGYFPLNTRCISEFDWIYVILC